MTWYDTGTGGTDFMALPELSSLRNCLAPWNPNVRGFLLAGGLIGVRHRGGVTWLRRAMGESEILMPADRRVVRGHETVYVKLPREESGSGQEERRRDRARRFVDQNATGVEAEHGERRMTR